MIIFVWVFWVNSILSLKNQRALCAIDWIINLFCSISGINEISFGSHIRMFWVIFKQLTTSGSIFMAIQTRKRLNRFWIFFILCSKKTIFLHWHREKTFAEFISLFELLLVPVTVWAADWEISSQFEIQNVLVTLLDLFQKVWNCCSCCAHKKKMKK